jgi:cytochrome c
VRKKIIAAVVLVVMVIAGYVGLNIYRDHQYMEAVTPHIKNISLRVTNAALIETETSKVTYKEVFERLDGDVAEVEKRILEVQTISTADTKGQADLIINYLKASQEFLRALVSKFRKQLAASSAIEWAKQRDDDFWNDSGYSSYALKAASKARDERLKAIDEYQKAAYDVAETLARLGDARGKLALMAASDALVSDGVIDELKKQNPTKSQDQEQKATQQQENAVSGASLAPEALAKQSNCFACHDIDRKLVGPAYRAVSKKYAGQPNASTKLTAKVLSGGKGSWGELPMPPNPITKEEASKLVTWILSLPQK